MKCLLLIAVVANISLLAAAATEGDILVLLFTRENKGNSQKVRICLNDANALKSSKFNGRKPTKILVRGWFGGFNSADTWLKNCKDALLNAEDVNVFVVDWGRLAGSPLYVEPAKNTRFVGEKVARFAEFLEKSGGADRKRMHFIGHSLGGQVVGFVGKNLNPKPTRITGLDTAEVGFKASNKDDFLDQSDADFVDEIHTLVSKKIKGHADFYPNGEFIRSLINNTIVIMSDVAAPVQVKKASKPAAPVQVKKASKPKKVKAPAAHPKYSEMVVAAIKALKERGGSSRQAILKYIMANYKLGSDASTINPHLKMALKRAVDTKLLKQVKGTGASGSFKVGEEPKVKKPKAKKPKATKKPKAAKKPKAKSPKSKKAKTLKKAKSPQKAKSPKSKTAKPKKAAKSPKKAKTAKPKTKKAAPKKK